MTMENTSAKRGSTANPFEEVKPITSVQELWARSETDPWLASNLKHDPVKTIAAVFHPPLDTDKWIYRIVVAALGFTILGATAGAIFLAANKLEAPDLLVSLGSAAVGALAGLLAPSPSRKSE